MIDLFAVWTPGSLLSAVVGGFLVGLFVVSRFDNPRYTARESVGVVVVIGAFAGTVFYAGQAVDSFVDSGPALGWRVVSRFVLFLLFIVAMAVGSGIGVQRHRGGWSK